MCKEEFKEAGKPKKTCCGGQCKCGPKKDKEQAPPKPEGAEPPKKKKCCGGCKPPKP